ncbi:MAG: hypothetical protein ACRENE_09250, partial [Polyangiaceae bacterium]
MKGSLARMARVASPVLAVASVCAAGAAPAGADEGRVLVADEPPFYPGTQGAITPPRDRPAWHAREGSGHRPYHPAPG